MSHTVIVDPAIIQQWVHKKISIAHLQEQLPAQGWDEEKIHAYLQQLKKVRTARRQWIGFICMGTGAFMGFVCCVLSLTNPFPNWYNFILYVPTTLAIVVIGVGLYYVFE